jgi:hypothetical protein
LATLPLGVGLFLGLGFCPPPSNQLVSQADSRCEMSEQTARTFCSRAALLRGWLDCFGDLSHVLRIAPLACFSVARKIEWLARAANYEFGSKRSAQIALWLAEGVRACLPKIEDGLGQREAAVGRNDSGPGAAIKDSLCPEVGV